MAAPLQWVRDQAVGPDPAVTVAAVNTTLPAQIASGKRVLFDGCTITADTAATAVVQSTSGTVRFCQLTGQWDGLVFVGGPAEAMSLVEDTRITGPGVVIDNRHHDGIQFWQGGRTTIRRCVISGWNNSAIFIKSDLAPISLVNIQQCVLSCDSYFPIYVRDGGFGRPTKVSVTGCVFDKYAGPFPISTGNDQQARYLDQETKFVHTEAQRTDPTWVVWSGNTKPDGTEIPPPGGWIA